MRSYDTHMGARLRSRRQFVGYPAAGEPTAVPQLAGQTARHDRLAAWEVFGGCDVFVQQLRGQVGHLPRAAGIPAQDTRQPAIFPRPGGVIPAIAAVILWITVLGLARAIPPGSPGCR